MNNDSLFQIALLDVPKLGNQQFRTLMKTVGSAEQVFKMSADDLKSIKGIRTDTADSIVAQASAVLFEAEKEMATVNKLGLDVVGYLDPNYPKRFKAFDDTPSVMYLKGNPNLNAERTVGVVGTRNPTDYAKSITNKILDDIKEYNPMIVSGLAYGVDITAHRYSLQIGLPTIAILGQGLSTVYPSEHKQYAKQIVEAADSGLVSIFKQHYGPKKEHFPMRNRVLAALVDALIVIETNETGGSVITANMAYEYKKDVFAVPSRLKDPQGCNKMILKNRASIYFSGEEMAAAMGWIQDKSKKAATLQLFQQLSPEQERICQIFRDNEPTLSLAQLNFFSNINNSQLASILLELEFLGVLESLPGMRYRIN